MADHETDIELSAYADGELDAAHAGAPAERANSDAAARRTIAFYRQLDEAAARLPVPAVDDAGARKAWETVAQRTTQVSSAERRACARIEQAAATLPVPQLSEAAAASAWRNVAQRTTEVSAADQRVFARLDQAAAALPVPVPGADAFERAWAGIAGRVVSPPHGATDMPVRLEAPAVPAQQWDKVWQGIVAKTRLRAAPAREQTVAQAESPRVVRGDFRRHAALRWRWLAAASAAAAILLGLLVYVPQSGQSTAALDSGIVEVPEVLDDRYQVVVEYPEGQKTPVVCFFLKDDAGQKENAGQDFQWLPY